MPRYNLQTISVDTKSHDSIDDISVKYKYAKDRLFKASEFKDNIYYASKNWDNWFYKAYLKFESVRNNISSNDNYHFINESCAIEEELLDGDLIRHYYHPFEEVSFNSVSRGFNY